MQDNHPKPPDIRLNLGCGGRPLAGYINIDQDTLEDLKKRYPGQAFPEGVEVHNYDIFNLPYPDGGVAEVRADAIIEHLSFADEKRIFLEVKRVLRKGGVFSFSVPDFEELARMFLRAEDDWRDFYRCDDEAIAKQHWFGQYSFSMKSRWGYLTAALFGPQNCEGQFHRNCYTEGKIRAIMKHIGFDPPEITPFRWKNTELPMLQVRARKGD